ncbi:MAG: A24 family peptidase [Candidatus Diapherotrites archaeon]
MEIYSIEFLRIAIILIGCAIAAYSDFKTGLIYDKVTYAMIGLGLILNALEFDLMLFSVGTAVFVCGYVAYRLGKVGGGDVKLLTGIALLLPFYGDFIFVVNVVFAASAISVIVLATYYSLKYAKKGIEWKSELPGIIQAGFFGAAIILYFGLLFQMKLISFDGAVLMAGILLFALLFLALQHGIRKNFFLKEVELGKLEEDEVLADEFIGKETKDALGLKFKGVLGEKEIAKLKEMGVAKVPVYRDMPPFAPFILIGVLISLLEPNFIGLIFI